MGPIYLGQFHLIYHGTCEDEEQLKNALQSPLNKWGRPANINMNHEHAAIKKQKKKKIQNHNQPILPSKIAKPA